jgi:phage tail sheath protein FI
MPVSPGIYVREFDFSDYAPLLGVTLPAFLGGASKGPVGVPIKVTNVADLTAAFGNPLPGDVADRTDYGLHAAVQYLQQGGNMLYCRVAHSALSANYAIPGNVGGTRAVAALGTIQFVGAVNPADGDTITLHGSRATADLAADVLGTAANQVITKTGANITVVGMSGGRAAGTLSPSDLGAYASGTVVLAGQPASGNSIVLNDGVNPATTFEFATVAGVDTGTLKYVVIGVDVYATLTALVAKINGVTTTLTTTASDSVPTITFEFDSDNNYTPTNIPVAISAISAINTMANLVSAIGTYGAGLCNVSVVNTTVAVPQCTLTSTTPGLVGNATILVDQAGSVLGITGMASGADEVLGPVATVMTVEAASPGTWGNGTVVQVVKPTSDLGATTLDPINDPLAERFDLYVYQPVDDGSSVTLIERFSDLSLYPSSARYVATAIANGIRGEFGPSSTISVTVVATSSSIAAGNYTLGTGAGVVGTNGISGLTYSDYVGSIVGQTATGLQALRNPERVEFNLLAIPGIHDVRVINAAISIANKRGDFLYVIDAPFGLTVQQVIDWHNGNSTIVPNSPTGPINSNYCALYWPWVKTDDPYNDQSIWLPPSGFVLGAMAYTDQTVGPWWTVAGPVRGLLASGSQIEYSADQDDRDLLIGIDTSNQVNPIIDRADTGLTIWGNRTLQRKRTALNSIHVRRMLIYAEKVCATAVATLVFNPNDSQTWREFTDKVNTQLSAIQAARGIAQFKVICDATTNPPQQIQNKTMRGKILIQPVEAAEIILMDFTLTQAGITTALAG